MGNDSSLINLCENINQFLSGIFIAVREKNQNLQCPELLNWPGKPHAGAGLAI